MAKTKNHTTPIELQIKAIEILGADLNLPEGFNAETNFNFNITIESQADEQNKIVFVIVKIQIKNDDQSLVLGTLTISCIYHIINFNDVIKIEDGGKLKISSELIDVLNSISISTVRGVMFSTFKGTFLHNAILPIVDPQSFKLDLNT